MKYLQLRYLLKKKLDFHIKGSDIRSRIISGTFWIAIGTFISRGVAVFLSFLLARVLGKAGFGEYGVINNTSAMISSVAGLGLGSTVTRYIARLNKNNFDRTGKIIGLSLFIAFFSAFLYSSVFVFLAPWLASTTLSAPHLATFLQISSITAGLAIINNVQSSILLGLEEFKLSSILSSFLGILQSILIVVLAYFWSLHGAVIGLAVATCISLVAYNLVYKKKLNSKGIQVRLRGSFSEWRILIKYSLPSFLSTIIVGPVFWISNTFLAKQPKGYEHLGVLTAALQWETFLLFFPGLFTTVLLPIMSDMYGVGDKKGSIRVMWKMVRITSYVIIPLAFLISFLSPFIINAYGESFSGGYWVIIIISMTTIFSSIAAHFGTFILASGRIWYGFILNAIWSCVFLFLSSFLVKWGAEGLAGARFISYIIHLFLSIILIKEITKKYETSPQT